MTRAAVWLCAALITVGGAAACAAPVSPATAAAIAAHPRAAEIWGDKCASCHVPVEPGTRTTEALRAALAKHRSRARITSAEWDDLVEFLAAAPARTAIPPR